MKMKNEILGHKIIDVLIYRERNNDDRVIITIDAESTFPSEKEVNQLPKLILYTEPGYAEEWLAKVGITEFRIL